MKKSQMEIIGLVVIVIIIIFGLLFFLSRALTKKPDTLKQMYTDSQLASNLLNSMARTNLPECNGATIEELYKDAATIKVIKCKKGSAEFTSQDYAKIATDAILSKTLIEWNRPYNLYVTQSTSGTKGAVFYQDEKCTSKEKQAAIKYIPLNPGTIMMQLEICNE